MTIRTRVKGKMTEQPYKEMGDRLKKLRGPLSQKDFAEKIGVNLRSYIRYENGERIPKGDVLYRMSALFQVPIEWIMTGELKKITLEDRKEGIRRALHAEGIEYTEEDIDRLITGEGVMKKEEEGAAPSIIKGGRRFDVYSLAGAGSPKDLTDQEPLESLVLPEEFFSPELVPVKVRGESMEPAILDGAVVGVDRADRQVVSGRLYAVWIPHEGAVIKRLFMEMDRVLIRSDNPAFPEMHIKYRELEEAAHGDNFILGRVRWIVQKYY